MRMFGIVVEKNRSSAYLVYVTPFFSCKTYDPGIKFVADSDLACGCWPKYGYKVANEEEEVFWTL